MRDQRELFRVYLETVALRRRQRRWFAVEAKRWPAKMQMFLTSLDCRRVNTISGPSRQDRQIPRHSRPFSLKLRPISGGPLRVLSRSHGVGDMAAASPAGRTRTHLPCHAGPDDSQDRATGRPKCGTSRGSTTHADGKAPLDNNAVNASRHNSTSGFYDTTDFPLARV